MKFKAKYAQLAEKMAYKSSYRTRVGCVIVSKNTIISLGFNDGIKTHPKSPHPFYSLHAEVDAVVSARTDISGSIVYVARILKNGKLAMSKPCEHCEALLRRSGVKAAWYSTNDGWELESYD